MMLFSVHVSVVRAAPNRRRRPRPHVLHAFIGALLALALSAANPSAKAIAQCSTSVPPGTWAPIGPPLATVLAFERDPDDNGTVYVGTHFGGLYRSQDGGLTWCHIETPFSSDVVFTIEIVPTTPRIIYVGTQDGGVFRSGDGGITWTPRNNGLTTTVIRDIEVDPFNHNIVLAGSFPGIFRSDDEGQTWELANSKESILPGVHIEFDPLAQGTVYAATQSLGVYRSTNHGLNWHPFRSGIGKRDMTSLSWDVNDPDRLLCSAADGVFEFRRGGFAWNNLTLNLRDSTTISHVASIVDRPELFASTDSGIYILDPADRRDHLDPPIEIPLGEAKSSPAPKVKKSRPSAKPRWKLWYEVKARRVDGDRTGSLIHVAHSINFFEVTDDGGKAFYSVTQGLQSLFCGALATMPINGVTALFAGTGNDIRLTSDFFMSDGVYPWIQLLDAGGALFELTPDPSNPGTLYAGTEGNGVLRTTDFGETWTNISVGMVPKQINSIDESHESDGTLYAATGAGIYVSKDDGDTWTHRAQNQNPVVINDVEADPVFPGWVYYGREDGRVFRSQDFGENFLPLWQAPPGEEVIDLEVAPFFEVYAITSSGSLYTSSDQGQNFFRRGESSIEHDAVCVAVDETRPWKAYVGTRFGGVYRTETSAIDWEQRISGMDTPLVFSLAIDPDDSSVIYAGSFGKIYKSCDEAMNWAAHSSGLPADAFVVSIAIDPNDTSTLFAKVIDRPHEGLEAPVAEGIYRSTDGGMSWSQMTDEMQFKSTDALLVSRKSPGVVFTGSEDAGIFRSEDDGLTWLPSSEGLTLIVLSIVVDPNDPNVLYAGSLSSGIFKSTDAGETWSPSGLSDYIVFSLTIDPTDSQTLYAGTSLGLMRSFDAGQTWRLVGQETPFILSLAADPSSPETLYSGSYAGECFRSDDGGQSWEQISQGLPADDINAITVSPIDGTVFVATANSGIFRSVDQGSNWWPVAPLFFPDERILDLEVNPTTGDLLASTWGNAFISPDRGDSWFVLPTGFGEDYPGSMCTAFFTASSSVLFLAVLNEQGMGIDPGVPVLRSVDDGQSWHPASDGIASNDARAIAAGTGIVPPLYVAAIDGVYRSLNLGGMWVLANNGLEGLTVTDLFVSRESNTHVFAATNAGLYHSTNSGDSWQPMELISGESFGINKITGGVGGRIYAGATDRGVFASNDSGASWIGGITLNTSVIVPHGVAIDPNNPERILLATGTTGFAVSENQGVSWKLSNNGLGSEVLFAIAIDPIEPNTVYVSSNDAGVWVSEDGGSTWNPMNDGLFNHFVTAIIIDALDRHVLYAGTEGGGVFRIVRP